MHPIPYGRQSISTEDIEAVVAALQADFLTQGPRIQAFEEAFAEYIGARYAVAVANGTAALHLCALALDVRPGQKVITSPITFAASANCVRYCGGSIDLADIDPETALLDTKYVRQLLEKAPPGTYAGIIPVDFAGQPVKMDQFRKLADEFGLWIIEDACHAPGAAFVDGSGKKQKAGNGTYADLAIFSFHPVKHLTTGEGGMITTNNEKLYERLKVLRTHGITKDPDRLHENHGGWYYEMQELGFNYRITDIQCALGQSQLKNADAWLERRREIARRYDAAFQNSRIRPLKNAAQVDHAYHLYVIQVENRRELYDWLRSRQIYAQVHYIPIHLLPYYQELGWKKGDLPQAEHYYDRCLSLPMFPTLTDEELEYVIKSVLEISG